MTNSIFTIDINATQKTLNNLFRKKRFHFSNYMPSFFCDGAPTFTFEFNHLQELENILKNEDYRIIHLFNYKNLKERLVDYSLEYKPSLYEIEVIFSSTNHKEIYHVGSITKISDYKIDYKQIVENFLRN